MSTVAGGMAQGSGITARQASQGPAPVVSVRDATVLDSVRGLQPSGGNKLWWLTIEVSTLVDSLKSLPVKNIKAVDSNRREYKLVGYSVSERADGDRSAESVALPRGQIFVNRRSSDGAWGYINNTVAKTQTFAIDKVPALLPLIFEVPASATLSAVHGFGADPIKVPTPSKR